MTERCWVPLCIITWRVGAAAGLAMERGESVIHSASLLAHAVTGEGSWVAMGQCQSEWWQLKSPTTSRGREGQAAAAESMVEVRHRRWSAARAHWGGR